MSTDFPHSLSLSLSLFLSHSPSVLLGITHLFPHNELVHLPYIIFTQPLLSGCWFSLPHLLSNWLNFLCTELNNTSTSTFFLWASQIALIQPVHDQGYILIFLDRVHLLFTQVHFLFWQPGRVGGQYTTYKHSGKLVLVYYFPFILSDILSIYYS